MQSEATIVLSLDTKEVGMFLDLIESVLLALPRPDWFSAQEKSKEEALKKLAMVRTHFAKKESDQKEAGVPDGRKQILINGVEYFTNKDVLSYFDIVMLAENTDSKELSVTWYDRTNVRDGILMWPDTVKIYDGMAFTACRTGNA